MTTLPEAGQLSVAAWDTSASACLSTNIDVANLDLQFDLSDISESNVDASGDMFL